MAFSVPGAYLTHSRRARFDHRKDEKDMMKATQLLREAEEFRYKQHPQPYIFPDSPGGYECCKVPEWCLDDWHPSEKAMHPDYFAKRAIEEAAEGKLGARGSAAM
ncbi:NADH dehydrogenase [ubiquinone] 1 beta subcomplex subunit 9 [Tupaia chinensis]|uniref:NADH dehydrogenase [ubiquinone] 1 beta subcomplex subunit 9 n=1 Tax=Tupaia chinensis TaxID=246437 RepID=L9JFM4_TUPCH|nr:NADH dehydrogenase [ubiquinone] 1 beta subcomplex subunit 9 [Tupaia chinensis]